MEKLLALAKESGAESAKIIDPATVVTAPWPAFKCQFGCKKYGTGPNCPPRTPKYTETREVLKCYSRALLFHCHQVEKPTEIAKKLEREAFLSGYYKAFGFGCGPCGRCKKCNQEKCNFPNETAPAMEACGIDVFATVRANGYFIEPLREHGEEENYYGLVLLD